MKICERLASLDFVRKAGHILSYAATENEVNLFPLEEMLPSAVISYPVSYEHGIMEAYALNPGSKLKEGKYGILAPVEEESQLVSPEDIDVVLVPCVGFSEKLERLGHGAGYYDRYLPKCKKAKFICIAFEAQKLDNIVTDEHDVKMDMAVTENKIYMSE